VLKICLQLLVCVTIAMRLLMLFNQLRRAWRQEGHSLAAEFQSELRRRGLLSGLPDGRGHC
jgi:hypothetical protein